VALIFGMEKEQTKTRGGDIRCSSPTTLSLFLPRPAPHLLLPYRHLAIFPIDGAPTSTARSYIHLHGSILGKELEWWRGPTGPAAGAQARGGVSGRRAGAQERRPVGAQVDSSEEQKRKKNEAPVDHAARVGVRSEKEAVCYSILG
jgi:hypothetical protein